MLFRKNHCPFVSFMITIMGTLCAFLFMAQPLKAMDENNLAEKESVSFEASSKEVDSEKETPKKKRGKNKDSVIQSEESVESNIPEVDVADGLFLKSLSELQNQASYFEELLEVKGLQIKLIEADKKIQELDLASVVVSPQELAQRDKHVEEEFSKTVFPMPGGNPMVTSIIGGSKKAFEATLVFPNGTSFDVVKGNLLENGYLIGNISSRGVTIQKDGLQYTVMLTSNKSSKPWSSDTNIEMGTPVN